MGSWLGLPPDWSLAGHHVDRLIVVVHVVMLALFVGAALSAAAKPQLTPRKGPAAVRS